jgi:glutaredoxin
MNVVVIFTLDGCSHCVDLKKKLDDLKIQYIEIEVTKNKEIWDKVVEQTGHNSLPSVYISIDGGDTGPIFVPERDYETQDELIEKIKNYL